MLLIIFLLLLVGVLNISVGLIVLSRNIRKPLNVSFFLLAVGCAGWVGGIAAFLLANTSDSALQWAKLYYLSPVVIGFSSVLFAQVFPSGGKLASFRTYSIAAFALLLMVSIALVPEFLFHGVSYHSWGKEILLNRGQYLLYSIYLGVAFYQTLRSIFHKTKVEKGIYRAQAKIFFGGYLVSCILGVFFNLLLPWSGRYDLIWIGPLASSFYIAATAYGIVRHKLFDIRAVVARAFGYSVSLFVLASLYGFVVLSLIRVLSGKTFSLRIQIMLSAATAVTSMLFPAIKRFFDRQTNRLFYRDAYEAQDFLSEINTAVINNVEVEVLLQQAAGIIEKYMRPQFCGFDIGETNYVKRRTIGRTWTHITQLELAGVQELIETSERRMVVTEDLAETNLRMYRMLRDQDVAIVARLSTTNRLHTETSGYLVLGSKKSGNIYNHRDLEMVRILAGELAIAVQNALRFEEIEEFNVTLQAKVDDATRKLRKSNEKLKAMDQTKDEFISMASHQLRTPLTSVKGYVSMVMEGDAGPINDMQRQLLNQAFVSSQRMVFLIADLLNLSRLRTGKFIIEASPINLANTVEGEVKQLIETAESRNLTLTYQKPQHFPTLMLDETKIRQVIMNFMDNAIYYTPSGGHITANLRETDKSVEFTVVDDGIGVPKHEQPHLFNKFYRAGNAKKARPDGTGLGLFMAKKVIVAQGGSIVFRSVEGKGSTFGFTFAKEKLMTSPNAAPVTHEATMPAATNESAG